MAAFRAEFLAQRGGPLAQDGASRLSVGTGRLAFSSDVGAIGSVLPGALFSALSVERTVASQACVAAVGCATGNHSAPRPVSCAPVVGVEAFLKVSRQGIHRFELGCGLDLVFAQVE